MGKLRSMICLSCLLLLIPALIQAHRILPLDTRPLVAEKYAGWTGVLNLWVYEGWPCGSGSICPWLYQCIAAFEKAHPGVYVQPLLVDAGAITAMNDSGILPPDMLLFPPDLLSTPSGLKPLAPPRGIRPELAPCGEWNGSTYAVPVAIGGYLWAWNTGTIDALPDSWRDVDAVLSVPEPQRWRRWDVALLALCSGRYAPNGQAKSPGERPSTVAEIELGLAGGETPVPSPTPVPREDATIVRRLPKGFQYDADAWRHFINGEAAAMPVTQREIRRLQSLSEQGKGPQWQVKPGDNAFSDQLLCLAIVDRSKAAQGQALCMDFLAWLLSDDCQSNLCRASAFSVTGSTSGYGASDPLSVMDATLRSPRLAVPPVFGGGWVNHAEEIVRKFRDDTVEAPALWGQLRQYLAKNTNY